MAPALKLAFVASIVLSLAFASEATAQTPQAADPSQQVTVVGDAAQTAGKGLHKGVQKGKKNGKKAKQLKKAKKHAKKAKHAKKGKGKAKKSA